MYQGEIKWINSYKELIPLYLEFHKTDNDNIMFRRGLLAGVSYSIKVFIREYNLHFENEIEEELFLTNFPQFVSMYYKLYIEDI